MTTIAWDGKRLAADRLFAAGNGVFSTTKIFRVNSCLVGITGTFSLMVEVMEWWRRGAKPEEFPAAQRDSDRSGGMLVVHPSGRLEKYEGGPYPLPVHDVQFAMGSGGDFARAAMYLGESAVRAIEIAAVFDTHTGGGVDSLTFEDRLSDN